MKSKLQRLQERSKTAIGMFTEVLEELGFINEEIDKEVSLSNGIIAMETQKIAELSAQKEQNTKTLEKIRNILE